MRIAETRQFLGLFVSLAVMVSVIGCGGRPAGFPDLLPATVEVVDGSTPLANVSVVLSPTPSINSVVCSGRTDNSGIAAIITTLGGYQQAGAPASDFTLTLVEQITVPTKSASEISAMSFDQQKAYDEERAKQLLAVVRKVPADLSDPEKTPLKWKLSSSSSKLQINIADYKKQP